MRLTPMGWPLFVYYTLAVFRLFQDQGVWHLSATYMKRVNYICRARKNDDSELYEFAT